MHLKIVKICHHFFSGSHRPQRRCEPHQQVRPYPAAPCLRRRRRRHRAAAHGRRGGTKRGRRAGMSIFDTIQDSSLSQVTCSICICPCYLSFGLAFWIFQPLWQPPVFCIIVTSTSELLYSRLSSPRLSTCEKRRSLPSFHAFHMFNILSSFKSTDL